MTIIQSFADEVDASWITMIPFLDASSTFSELPHILSSIQTSKGSEGSQNNGVCYFVMKMITQLTCGVHRDYPPGLFHCERDFAAPERKLCPYFHHPAAARVSFAAVCTNSHLDATIESCIRRHHWPKCSVESDVRLRIQVPHVSSPRIPHIDSKNFLPLL